MFQCGLSWSLGIFLPCSNLFKSLIMKWNSMCIWSKCHIIDHSPIHQYWKLLTLSDTFQRQHEWNKWRPVLKTESCWYRLDDLLVFMLFLLKILMRDPFKCWYVSKNCTFKSAIILYRFFKSNLASSALENAGNTWLQVFAFDWIQTKLHFRPIKCSVD